ncbi:MAG: hypothetical protein V1792_24990 [Pseudomonadota bacterium]
MEIPPALIGVNLRIPAANPYFNGHTNRGMHTVFGVEMQRFYCAEGT